MADRWLPVEEIAEHLGIKKYTVYKWVKTRQMPVHKVGRLLKFQVNEIDQWVRELKRIKDAAYILGKAGIVMRQLATGMPAPQCPVQSCEVGEKLLEHF